MEILDAHTSHFKSKEVIWCTHKTNLISVRDLAQPASSLKHFEGTKLSVGSDETFVAWIPDTNNVISLHHDAEQQYANLEIYDISTKRCRFSFSGVHGEVGAGDLSVNQKRRFFAALPQEQVTSYHLFDSSEFELIKKAKWHDQQNSFITSMDFNAEGTKISLFQYNGQLIVLDVDSNQCLFDYNSQQRSSFHYSRCRWSPIFGSSLVAIKYKQSKLLMMDLEKQGPVQSNSYDFEYETYSMDWRCDGNLIAFGDAEYDPKIYDIRKGKVVKTYINTFESSVWSVKWSQDGALLGVASDREGANVIDLKADKIICRTETPDKRSIVSLTTFIMISLLNNARQQIDVSYNVPW